MSKSRNERRKAAQARLTAKSKRIAAAFVASELGRVREVVSANGRQPHARDFKPVMTTAYQGLNGPRAISR